MENYSIQFTATPFLFNSEKNNLSPFNEKEIYEVHLYSITMIKVE